MSEITIDAQVLTKLIEALKETVSLCESLLSSVGCLHQRSINVTTMGSTVQEFLCGDCAYSWQQPWPEVTLTVGASGD